MIGQSRFPGDRSGFAAVGQAPIVPSDPFVARAVAVRARVMRGPFGGWIGRFRERLGGVPGGQTGQVGGGYRDNTATTSLMPHRVVPPRNPAFWAPVQHYKRQEYLVSPPSLPGTAIPYTLFHPVYIPGLQGWKGTLQYNYGWIQGKLQNFEKWDMLRKVAEATVTGRGRQQNVWKPAMRVPQGVGQGQVWRQPRPYYVPIINNPPRKRDA